MNDVARRLRPPAGGGAPHQVALPGAEPVLGLHRLAAEVALAVADRLGGARRAGGEHDQGGVVGAQFGGGRGRRGEQALVGHHSRGPANPAARTVSAFRSSASTRRRAPPRPSARAGRAARSCSVQGRATAPMRKQASMASTHSGRLPTTVMTTSPGRHPVAHQSARQTGRAVGDLAERELGPRPSRSALRARSGRDRRRRRRRGEVHAAILPDRIRAADRASRRRRFTARRILRGNVLACPPRRIRTGCGTGEPRWLRPLGRTSHREARKLFQREPVS